tara:strand:+ start:777 stop:926 length:150 start_codon:yes stop_codon:yes gene_type:complete
MGDLKKIYEVYGVTGLSGVEKCSFQQFLAHNTLEKTPNILCQSPIPFVN